MLMATFINLIWKKGEVQLMQGVQGNRTPYNAISGGNGSFIVVTEPAKVILELQSPYGFEEFDIINDIKYVKKRKRMSQKLINTLKEGMKGKVFSINQYGELTNIRAILKSIKL